MKDVACTTKRPSAINHRSALSVCCHSRFIASSCQLGGGNKNQNCLCESFHCVKLSCECKMKKKARTLLAARRPSLGCQSSLDLIVFFSLVTLRLSHMALPPNPLWFRRCLKEPSAQNWGYIPSAAQCQTGTADLHPWKLHGDGIDHDRSLPLVLIGCSEAGAAPLRSISNPQSIPRQLIPGSADAA